MAISVQGGRLCVMRKNEVWAEIMSKKEQEGNTGKIWRAGVSICSAEQNAKSNGLTHIA